MNSVEEQLRKYIADNILFSNNGYPYSDDTSFLENGVVDSMNVMELVMFVEETFHVSVKDEEVVPDNFDSIQSLASYVMKKQEKVA